MGTIDLLTDQPKKKDMQYSFNIFIRYILLHTIKKLVVEIIMYIYSRIRIAEFIESLI